MPFFPGVIHRYLGKTGRICGTRCKEPLIKFLGDLQKKRACGSPYKKGTLIFEAKINHYEEAFMDGLAFRHRFLFARAG